MNPRPHGHVRLVREGEAPVRRREADDFDALFEQHWRYVARIAHRMLGRTDEVDDAVQDVFAIVYRRRKEVAELESVKQWIGAVTVKRCYQLLRRRSRRRWTSGDDEASFLQVRDPRVDPEQQAMIARVGQVLDKMAPRQRVAWTLRYLEGETLEEVARLANTSLATAKRRIAAAHLTIQEALCDG